MRPALLCVAVLLLSTPALGQEIEVRRRLGISLEAGPDFVLDDGGKMKGPETLLRFAASKGIMPHLGVGLAYQTGAFESHKDLHHPYAFLQYGFRVPLVTRGSDWDFNDYGYAGNADIGMRMFPFRGMGLLTRLGFHLYCGLLFHYSDAHVRNSSYPEWVRRFNAGGGLLFNL